tara:strand:- start:169 stop:438 length:270 start_codon:yes stop_codon:yes gene_type:complete
MPFPTGSGSKSEVDQKLKSKRQQIIEDERIRVLSESFMNFYDLLMQNYELIRIDKDQKENDEEYVKELVPREEIDKFARNYAETKPLGF